MEQFVSICSVILLASLLCRVSANGFLNKNKGKINNHLILTATKNPLAGQPNLTTVNAGIFEKIILDLLSEQLNFTYSIYPPTDIMSSGLMLSNGSWTGSTGQLQRQEVDMHVSTTAPTPARRLVTDTSYPVFFVDAAILVPFPKEEVKTQVLVLIFQPGAWIGVSAAFVCLVFIVSILHRITNPRTYDRSQIEFNYWMFFFVSAFTNQGVTLRNTATTFRFVLGLTFFGIFIICNFYTAAWTSLMSTPIFKHVIGSVEELANSQTVKTLLVKGSSTDEYLMLTKDPIFKKIGDQMRFFPKRRILNAFTVDDISTVVKDDYALIILKPTAKSLIQKSYEINKKCRVTMAEKTFYSRGQSFTYPKNSFLTRIIDQEILLFQQSGLTTYAARRADSISRNPCSLSAIKATISSASAVQLKLEETIGAFILLAVGIGVAGLTFILELIAGNCKMERDI